MVLFVTPARWRWAYDYFWLCVGAYSSDWSSAVAGTSAPLILTHDPCIWHTKSKLFSKRRATLIKTHLESFVSSSLSRLLFHPFRIELLATFPHC
jgi:hypothetical protein